MEKLTGVVMERTGSHCILLTPQGEFKKVRVTGRIPDIGDEISVAVARKRFFNMPKASWMAVAAAVILLVIASPLLTMFNQPPEVAMAYVSIDINPSIELTVGSRYHVMDAQAYNQDGRKVLAGLGIKGVYYEEAVSAIKKRTEELGYLEKSHGNTVVFSVAFLPGAEVDKAAANKNLTAPANSVFSSGNVTVASINVPQNIREEARKKGSSPGKYAVLIEAVTQGIPVTEQNIQDKPIADAISGAGGQPEQVLNQAVSKEQFDVKYKKYLAIASNTGLMERPSVFNGQPAEPVTTVAENNVSTGNADNTGSLATKPGKSKYVDSIRKRSGPEDTHSSYTGNSGEQVPAVTAPPAAVSSTPGDSADSNNPAVGQNSAPSPTDDTTGDTNTSDNYMSSDQGSSNDNENMYILRPNF